ncbi:Hydrogen-sensing hydrogenase small subunit (HoxB/HupU) [hydrothermal vent metagenome]|uniref:Hydrogen-sensing hydrogenase small subunit (HoxB/HupU) n=1 Tax=hydrothermal vent metagenome TaxID=652676 RepID=A0A3B1BNS3_9ZZZZ
MNSPVQQQRNLLWLQSGGCGGCSLSLLGAESPDLFTMLGAAGINLLWHPGLSEQGGAGLHGLLQTILEGDIHLDLLCLEGAVIQGPNGSGLFHRLSGSERPMRDWIHELAQQAGHVLAVGSCAAYGGVTSAGGNPSEACGLQYEGAKSGGLLGKDFIGRAGLPVINIAGCPIHPDWLLETLLQISLGDLSVSDLDEFQRPRSYANHLVHHGCPRNEYYEFKASADKPSDLGCLMENLGCLGTQAHADCNTRLWNGEGSCLRGGYACINCTAPGFEEPGHRFTRTPKIAGIPIGLPIDMPKAWFVALASLSKAAMPARLKNNAQADHIRVAPGNKVKDE